MAVYRAYVATNTLSGELPAGYVTRATSSEVIISGGGVTTSITGYGFSYSNNSVVGGVVTDFVQTYNGYITFEGHGLSLSAPIVAQEILTGDPIGLFSYAFAGNDEIYGSSYDDFLVAYEGDDVIAPGGGDDYVYGDAGFDAVFLSGTLSDYKITPSGLHVFHIDDMNKSNGDEGYDIVHNIEYIRFSDGITINIENFSINNEWNRQSDNVEVVAATYQFFVGSIPNSGGFAFLINSPQNPADLSDPYYAAFNVENRYINFASNLGTEGAGKSYFDAAFGGLSFEQTVTLAYEEIMGKTLTGGAYDFFIGAHDFYEAVAAQRVVRPGVDLDDATKIVAIGSILNEAVKSGQGPYADAIDDLTKDVYSDGQSIMLGGDMFAFV